MKCNQCKRKSIIFRPYEGRYLCEKHFISSLEKKIAKAISKNKMIVKGDKVLTVLSGNISSMVLALLLKKFYGKRPDIIIFSISIDDGQSFSKEIVKTSSKFAKRIGIEHKVVNFSQFFGKKKIRENGAYAIARRWILNKKAKEMGITKIAVGQTLDDEAQSVLLNFLRGDIARLARLGPITNLSVRKTKNKIFIPRIKPLRMIPKSEIELYAKIIGIRCLKLPYKKSIRDDVSKFLKKMELKYPGVLFAIVETVDKLLPVIQKIAEYHEGPIIRCKKCGEPGSQSPCRTCQIWR